MVERIRYALFVLLFVLAGSLDGADLRCGADNMRADRFQPGRLLDSTLCVHLPVHDYFTAAAVACEASIENPGQPSGQKAVVRSRREARPVWAADVAFRLPAHSGGTLLHPKPVDYYIFSLGRILI